MFYIKRRSLQAAVGLLVWLAIAPANAQSSQDLKTITIGPRYSPNPLEAAGVAGGNVPVKTVISRTQTPTGECVGYTGMKPNHTIELTEFFQSLSLVVQSSDDTALTVQGPGGVWCNDDYQGKNPGVSGQWLPGSYKIWVNSYAKNRSPNYVLRITEKRQ